MKSSVGFGFLFAMCFVVVKMMSYFLNVFQEDIKPFALVNILFLIIAISLGLYQYMRFRREPDDNLMNNIKQALKAGFIYTVVVSGFLFTFYKFVDSSVISQMRNERIEIIKTQLKDPAALSQIKRSNHAVEMMEPDEMLEEATKNIDKFISPMSVFLISLLALLMLSILYSILISVIFRKVLFRI